MRQDAEKGGPSWAADGDNRITRVGAFIRKYRLDELPQFFNILHGTMSLVGPRPEQPYFCEMLETSLDFFSQRHTVRPGITGWAQIKYQYGSTSRRTQEKARTRSLLYQAPFHFAGHGHCFGNSEGHLFGQRRQVVNCNFYRRPQKRTSMESGRTYMFSLKKQIVLAVAISCIARRWQPGVPDSDRHP